MKDISDKLKENKPNISESSVKTYTSILKSLYFKHNDKNTAVNFKWFDNQANIIKLLKDKPASSRKTTFASLIALTPENDKYKKALLSDGKEYQTFIETQTKTPTQEANWKTFDEVKEVYRDMYEGAERLLNKTKALKPAELLFLQDFMIVALTSGYWIPPRRSSDWIYFRLNDIDKDSDNYIDEDEFVFNQYKTAKFYKQQRVKIPDGLKTILDKWVKINPHDTLLFDNSGKPLTAPRLTLKLNKIFDGRISTSMLRHIYLSDKLKDVPALNALQKQASDMGHSVSEALQYVKK